MSRQTDDNCDPLAGVTVTIPAPPDPAIPDTAATETDPLTLALQYKSEALSRINALQKRAAGAQGELGSLLESKQKTAIAFKDAALALLLNMSDVSTPSHMVLAAYTWTAVLLLSSWLSFFLGSNLLSVVVQAFFGRVGAVVVVLVLLPLAVAYYVDNYMRNDLEMRFGLLAFSILEGLLLGFAFSELHLYAFPPAFLFPATIGVVYFYASQQFGADRKKLLGASLSSSLLVFLFYGLIFGCMSATFFIFVILYAASSFVAMQIFFAHILDSNGRPYVHMVAYVMLILYSDTFIFLVFGQHQLLGNQLQSAVKGTNDDEGNIPS